MNSDEEKAFGNFLLKKKVITLDKLQKSFEVQQGLQKWGIEKSIDQVIVEKGFVDKRQMTVLLREHRGGDEELIRGYRITHKIGEGAMGEVYYAVDLQNDNRPVAIKILYSHLGKRKATAQRFLQEGRLCIEKLHHPNIVKGYEVGYEVNSDFFFYVMEMVQGSNLRKLLKDKGVFSENLSLQIMMQMTSALQHAFEFNLVHRDIKPDNIILTDKGEAKLCDLGLARDWAQDLSLTRTGAVMGTPFYISPEAAGGLQLDTRSDIYSLGASMYHMIVGQVPFDGPNSAVVLNRHRIDPLVAPIEHRMDISPGLSAVIEVMMAKSPDDRYQTPMELMEDLQKVQDGDIPIALTVVKGEEGFIETSRRSKTQVLEAIPASETEETSYQDPIIDLAKMVEKKAASGKFQDSVEEYLLDNEETKQPVKPHQGDKIFKSFFTSTERHMLSKAHNAQSKLLAIGAIMGGIIFVAVVIICYIVIKVLKLF